jgi:hypothetical protein
MGRFFKHYFLCLMLFNLAACSTMQIVSIENAMQYSSARGVDYGSLVEVKTLDHQTSKFRVTEMTKDGLGGNSGFFRFEDMKSLRVENPDAKSNGDAFTYILGALGIAALAVLIANADSVKVCSPSPCP